MLVHHVDRAGSMVGRVLFGCNCCGDVDRAAFSASVEARVWHYLDRDVMPLSPILHPCRVDLCRLGKVSHQPLIV